MTSFIKKINFLSVLAFLGLGLFLASCGCDEDCAEFSNFKLCDSGPSEDGCPSNSIILSQNSDFITISVEIKFGDPNDILSSTYFIEENGSFLEFANTSTALKDLADDLVGDERKILVSTGLSRNPTALWPKGNYKVEIELSQENIPLNETQNFTIE